MGVLTFCLSVREISLMPRHPYLVTLFKLWISMNRRVSVFSVLSAVKEVQLIPVVSKSTE